jgi:hypothetical protein
MFSSKYYIFFGIMISAFLMLFTCLHRPGKSQTEQTTMSLTNPVADTTASFSAVSENTRVALIEPCGRCHQSSLASHKPGAVAIFDLDAGEQWHSNLNKERLNGLDRRAMGNSSLSEEERKQIAEFVALKGAQLRE